MQKLEGFPQLEVRKANPEDADIIADLAVQTMIDTYPEQFGSKEARQHLEAEYAPGKLKDELQQETFLFHLAFWHGTLIGYSKMILNCPCEHLPDHDAVRWEKAYLIKEYQRNGIGAGVFPLLLQQLKSMGIKKAWLGVWEGNKAAIAFHEQMGFRAVGVCEYKYLVGDEERVDTDIVMIMDFSAL
jgi:diamine N-acetyltransferase